MKIIRIDIIITFYNDYLLQIDFNLSEIQFLISREIHDKPGPYARTLAAFTACVTGAPCLSLALGNRDKYVIILNSSTFG